MAPPKPLYFLTHYTATKNSFTLLEITIGQEKIYGWSAHLETRSTTKEYSKQRQLDEMFSKAVEYKHTLLKNVACC